MVMPMVWSGVRRILFWAIPLVLVATFVWTFLPRGRAVVPPPSVSPPAHVPGSVVRPDATPSSQELAAPYAQIRQGDLVGTDDAGRQRWRIVADDVTVMQNQDTVLLRNVRATLYEKGGGTITVTGSQGRYETKTHEVEIEGSVHGTSSNRRELFADQLRWVPASGQISGSGHIKLIQERVTMYADRMISDTTLGRTQFFGHVHAAVR
jgi:LPS export ABC transporter protein LptC